jgi:hypothetical protein
VVRQVQQGLSTIVILGTRTIWKQCSLCVFYVLRALLVYLLYLLRELKGFFLLLVMVVFCVCGV